VASRPGSLPTNGPFYGAPDLAVEILSPDDRMTRVQRKVRFYLANGVRLLWLIDPDNRIVTVMSTPDQSLVLTEDDELDGGDVLPGFRVPVRDILPPVQPPAS
jgi:Uma2 family endonuclease